jgi:hypothetical protein
LLTVIWHLSDQTIEKLWRKGLFSTAAQAVIQNHFTAAVSVKASGLCWKLSENCLIVFSPDRRRQTSLVAEHRRQMAGGGKSGQAGDRFDRQIGLAELLPDFVQTDMLNKGRESLTGCLVKAATEICFAHETA